MNFKAGQLVKLKGLKATLTVIDVIPDYDNECFIVIALNKQCSGLIEAKQHRFVRTRKKQFNLFDAIGGI